jgi:hypothetical protein
MHPDSTPPSHAGWPAHLLDSLRKHGYERDADIYRREGMTCALDGDWLVFAAERSESQTAQHPSDLGRPGLWKRAGNEQPPVQIFEVPIWAISEQPEAIRWDEAGPAPFDQVLDWAWETRRGRTPTNWAPPQADLVNSWLPVGALTVQSRGHVRQAEMILGTVRWALRLPILARLVFDLPEPRRHALEELAGEAQHRWAMVRMGVPSDLSTPALVAEVDLTGAPHSEPLFSAGLASLKHGVAWIVETADALADPTVEIACLAGGSKP